jgi:1-acyl-sn-glycerol-3-phosphate acyltransferase
MKHIRAAYRSIGAAAFLMATRFILVPLQNRVVGPKFNNHTRIPKLINKTLHSLFGYKIEFNKVAGAEIETKKKTWTVANHMSATDPIVLGSILKGSFVAAGWLTKIGLVNKVGKACRVLFVSQKKEKELFERDRGKIIEAFNEGSNVIMFPEGWTNDGSTVDMFRSGLVDICYGASGKNQKGKTVSLKDKPLMQPIAIRVKEVDGKKVDDNPELRQAYSMFNEKNYLKQLWKRLGYKNIVLELTVFPTLDPANYKNARKLLDDAHSKIVSVVAPDQKNVSKNPNGPS